MTDVTAAGAAGTTEASSSAPPAAVRLSGIDKVFPGNVGLPPVLENVSLTVAPGEFVTLLGASGCGKSTLLSIIAGLEQPTNGTVEVDGRPGLMFQESALFPWLSAGKNVELALKLRGVPRGERRAEAESLLERVNLKGTYDKRIHELSGGMRQRVALARSLGQESSVLLMDEPFAALDAITRDVLHEELVRVWSESKMSVVFVTHNVREAARLAQRVLLMSSRPGRFVREWKVDIPQPRRIEAPDVSELAGEITNDLRKEISRHAK